MQSNLNMHLREIEKLIKNKFLYISLGVLVFGLILNTLSSIYLSESENMLPVVSDLILNLLPTLNLYYVYNGFAVLVIIIFLFYVIINKKYEKVPYFILLIGILQILRGIFIVLTPFGDPSELSNTLAQKLNFLRYGFYFSGHTGTTFMLFLFSEGVYKKILFVLVSGLMIGLMLTHGHYSIDIFSAVIFAYAIYTFGERHLKEFK